MFPGQGSQYVGMGKDLLDQYGEISSPVFEEASNAIDVDIKKLCLEGPESDLVMTENTQPCILTVSIAYWRVLCSRFEVKPEVFAGHSLGEYSAAVACGKLDFNAAVKLVKTRGRAMQEAVPAGVGAMAAVMNFSADKLEKLCEQLSSEDEKVEIANYNNSKQIVVAGHSSKVDLLVEEIDKEGARGVKLQVSAPFHSSLMRPARQVMEPLLNDTVMAENEALIIPNVTAQAVENYEAEYLIRQIDGPVRWTQTLATCKEMGVDTYLEVGPGKVLVGLGRREIGRDAKFLLSENIADLDAFFN